MSTKPDYPFYNGQPVAIAPLGWLAVLAAVGAAFWLLVTLPLVTAPLNVIPAILFTGLPLVTLALVSRGHHTALFRPFGIKEFGMALGFGILTVTISLLVGAILTRFINMTPNASFGQLAAIGPVDLAFFLVRTGIQLLGEELMTILPLLAVLWLCVDRLGLSRAVGLTLGVIISTAWFAAVHLPTYNWNLVQCFGGIGAARLVLTAAYLLTRNLWIAAVAHITNDWTEFFFASLVTHMPIDPAA